MKYKYLKVHTLPYGVLIFGVNSPDEDWTAISDQAVDWAVIQDTYEVSRVDRKEDSEGNIIAIIYYVLGKKEKLCCHKLKQ